MKLVYPYVFVSATGSYKMEHHKYSIIILFSFVDPSLILNLDVSYSLYSHCGVQWCTCLFADPILCSKDSIQEETWKVYLSKSQMQILVFQHHSIQQFKLHISQKAQQNKTSK